MEVHCDIMIADLHSEIHGRYKNEVKTKHVE